jgi:hypothetical protein
VSDLVVFVAIVGLVAGVGIAVGMIVAGRIDRAVTLRQADVPADAPQEEHP